MLFFLREESIGLFVAARRVWNVVLFSSGIVLFVAARRIWNVVLFSSGRKVFYLYICCRSTSLERHAILLREERPCLFIIAQLDVLFDFPPLNEFGTSCCFLKGKHSSICIVVIARRIWNVVLVIDFVCL